MLVLFFVYNFPVLLLFTFSWTVKTFLKFTLYRYIYIYVSGVKFSSVWLSSVQFSLLSHVWLCDLMDCSRLGFHVHHQLLELAQTYPLNWWCHPTISSSVVPFSSCFQSVPASGSFLMNQFFISGSQSIRASVSL